MNTAQIVNVIKTLKKTELVFDNGCTLVVGKADIQIEPFGSDEQISIYPEIRERQYRVLYSSATLNKQGTSNATELREFWESNNFFFDIGSQVIADGRVEFRADLPVTIGFPAVGAIFFVEKPTVIALVWKQFKSGNYIKDTDTGSLSDWRKTNDKNRFTTNEFRIFDAIDQTKQLAFDVSAFLTSTLHTFIWQAKNGIISLLSPNVVEVTSLSDFPTPSAGFIPLAANGNVTYDIQGPIDIGANGLDYGTGNKIKLLGKFSSLDQIISTKTGDFIKGTNANISLELLTLINNDCTDFLNVNGGGTEIISLTGVIFVGTGNVGTLDGYAITVFQEWLLRNFTGGLTFSGSSIAALIRATQFVNCSGNLIDLGTSTFDTFEIDSMVAAVPSGSTAIKVAASGANINAGGEGIITSTNINITAGGVATVGYDPLDLEWNVYGNSESIITSDRITPTGWAFYQDGETSPVTQVLTTTPQKLQIDGLGSQTEKGFLPKSIRGIGDLWDVVNDKITPITIGDSYDLGIDIEVTAKTGGVGQIILTIDIGGGPTITVPIITIDSFVGKTPPFTKRISSLFFTLAAFKTNGGQIFVATDAGTVTIAARQITISRNSSGAS